MVRVGNIGMFMPGIAQDERELGISGSRTVRMWQKATGSHSMGKEQGNSQQGCCVSKRPSERAVPALRNKTHGA